MEKNEKFVLHGTFAKSILVIQLIKVAKNLKFLSFMMNQSYTFTNLTKLQAN